MSENIKGEAGALRSFAGQLSQISAQMRSNQTRIRGGFKQVSQTWRDSVQQQFEQEFQEASKLLENFLQEVESEHIPYVRQKADRLDGYTGG